MVVIVMFSLCAVPLLEWAIRAWRIQQVRRLIAAGLLALMLSLLPILAHAAVLKADCDPWWLEYFWICI